jgi:hypothetical protein
MVAAGALDVALIYQLLNLKDTEGGMAPWIDLSLAVVIMAGFSTRVLLSRRRTENARLWARALAPTRLGVAIVAAVLALAIVIVVLVFTR